MTNFKEATTEDLKATCQNYSTCDEAWECAIELQARIGKNQYSQKVFDLVKF